MSKPKKHYKRGILRKHSHLFVNPDPIVFTARSVHDEIGKPKYSQIARDTGLSYNTVRNLLEGDTVRPQHNTVMLIMDKAFGYTETWQRSGFTTRVVKPGANTPKVAKLKRRA